MAASYYLRCLGTPELRGPDGHPVKFRTRKHFALFIYLAVEPPQAHRRDRLAELFWPRVSEPEARHSLATAISTFRNKLGPRAVQADRDHLQLGLAGLELDLTRLERGEVLGDEFTPPLDIANFLDQFEPPDSAGFLHWRDRHQSRLFPAIREGLLKLIDRCRRTGNFRQIEVLADRLLGIDHLSEDGIRAKMEARAFDGDRLSALKLYEGWRERLQAELGASPSPIVEGIATRLRRRGLERTTGNEIPTVPTDQWKGHRFVGRSREYRVLYESWERTARKDSTSALVLGDSGVGKTTLADRLTTAAGLEGASAVRTQCYEVDREIPYAALSGLVRGLLDRPGASCTRTGALADLATCIGEVRQRFPSLPGVEPLQGEAVRVRLAEAAHELVSAVAEEGPVILVVDDIHLADDASIAVIHQLLRRTREQPVMVVLTARHTELDRSPSARRLRENAPALGVTTIEVPPMTEEESRELLGALVEGAGAAPTLAERRALLGAAGGFPMVLELLVRDWLADGQNALALTFNAMTTDPAQGSRAEHAYRALIERLIRDLPADVRNVLN
ncbi:MAG: ATP-binding protein, partial [Gemmatimonadales bacterium]